MMTMTRENRRENVRSTGKEWIVQNHASQVEACKGRMKKARSTEMVSCLALLKDTSKDGFREVMLLRWYNTGQGFGQRLRVAGSAWRRAAISYSGLPPLHS